LEGTNFRAQKSGAISFNRMKRSGAGSDIHFPLNLYWKIKSAKPNLIISSEMGMRTLLAVIFKISHPKVKLTLWLTLSERTESNYGDIRLLLRRFILSHADHVVVSGSSAARYIQTFIQHPKITIAPQAISLDFDTNYKESERKIEPTLLIVSSEEPRKNISWTVHNLNEWAQKNNTIMQLCIVGDLPSSIRLETFNFLKITNHGFVQHSEMLRIFQRVDLLIFPTLADEWGLVVNEAFANSVPVIGSHCAESVIELISDSYNGWIFDPKDATSFHFALTQFFSAFKDQNLYSKMKMAAKNTLSAKASVENLALALISNHEMPKETDEKIPNVIFSLRYLNKYRVPLIQQLSEILSGSGQELRVLGSIPNNAARKNQDLGWHPAYKVAPEIKFRFGKKEIRYRFIPRKYIFADVFLSEHAAGNLHNIKILILRRILRKPTILIGHGTNITSRQNFLSTYLERIQLRLCTLYLAYTPESAIRAKKIGGESISTEIFFNSTDTKTLTQLVNSFREISNKQTSEKWKAIYLGSFHASKNIEQLLSLCSRIYSTDHRFQITVCGEGDQEIFETMSSLSFVQVVGFKESKDLAKLAAQANIMLTTGRIGLNATDSFALRTPIVGLSKSVRHAPEFEYLNEANSLILPTLDEVFESVLRLMNSEEEIQKLKIGCDQSAKQYSIERSAQIIAKTISAICQKID
jgi:glycosyltransferase involved in cell wall biosynthesis